ncbi:MAG: polyphosphate:AMP phosphotransferase [Candidatus Binatia bacterium]|jgi:polyphosphate:AMP phosphotransferase
MFEAVEQDRKISKKEFEEAQTQLHHDLLQAQFALKDTRHPVIIIIDGVVGAGKGEVVHWLNEWLDPRGMDTHAFWDSSDEEDARPRYWQFWRRLPERGCIGILFGSWYARPISQRVHGEIKDADLERKMKRVKFFENMLIEDGTVIIKLWFHLSKSTQRERLKTLDADPKTRRRVLPSDWEHHKLYEKYSDASERALKLTHTERAPWHLIDATDWRHRELTTGQIVLQAMRDRLKPATPTKVVAAPKSPDSKKSVLAGIDLTQRIGGGAYKEKLAEYQSRLNELAWRARDKKVSCAAVFEGWDAAGKGGAIRRVTRSMDPRLFHLYSFAAPTKEELAQHYLWRFWRVAPKDGKMTVYDRSWYGRVLVERVEGFAREDEWRRAYDEINEFENQLVDHGTLVFKFWLQIDRDEQMARFKAREKIAHKRHKITDEDWRNREKWDAYEHAVEEMIERTSTKRAPWTLVAANQKKFARIQVLKTFCDQLEKRLK